MQIPRMLRLPRRIEMKKLLGILTILAMSTLPAFAQNSASFAQKLSDSVVLLYQQDQSGGMQMLCTATAYRKVDAGYRFVSASHCVDGKTETDQKSAKYFVTLDSEGAKTFIPATLVESGDKIKGDDFSIFLVKSDKELAVVPLGDDKKLSLGSPVVSIAAPLGLGKQYFQGYVSEQKIDRPPLDAGEVKWHDAMLIDIGSGPGSSGSAIVSADQHEIIGFLVGGTQANIGAIVIPVSQFKAFETAVDTGKYKKTKPADDKLTEDSDLP